MTDAKLIAEYLAKGGTVTVCPPRTFSAEPDAPVPWREQMQRGWRLAVAKRKAETGKRMRSEKLVPVKPIEPVPAPVVKAKPVKVKAAPKPKPPRKPRVMPTDRKPAVIVTDDQVRQALDTYGNAKGAAHALDINVKTLRRRAKAIGIHLFLGAPRTLKITTELLVQDLKEGLSIPQVEAKRNLGRGTVASRLKRAGLTVQGIMEDHHLATYGDLSRLDSLRGKRGIQPVQPVEIMGYRWDSVSAASDALGLSHSTIRRGARHDAPSVTVRGLHDAVRAWAEKQRRAA